MQDSHSTGLLWFGGFFLVCTVGRSARCRDSDSNHVHSSEWQLDLGLRSLGAFTPRVRLAEYCEFPPGAMR
ncbi:hypothetical protein M430DRAFT_37587 [Amorphotheca resinae ATCC 22711]|uniref:Secreted protein n=1 Tax=Amorphotheca resinae ATCC 22711 TaxID=857342 RepID=A0A2T3APK5_AMORE|nr:hypothetical protein M430DRAFT_37587 [Amorphotheca resinae ATCC 22711]PSS06939.1 hypothetical protein M430DRAFT_37587 [Amorphotheca resinae ATCC 22711]